MLSLNLYRNRPNQARRLERIRNRWPRTRRGRCLQRTPEVGPPARLRPIAERRARDAILRREHDEAAAASELCVVAAPLAEQVNVRYPHMAAIIRRRPFHRQEEYLSFSATLS